MYDRMLNSGPHSLCPQAVACLQHTAAARCLLQPKNFLCRPRMFQQHCVSECLGLIYNASGHACFMKSPKGCEHYADAVIPAEWYPKWAIQTNQNYLRDFGDPLVSRLVASAMSALPGLCRTKQAIALYARLQLPIALVDARATAICVAERNPWRHPAAGKGGGAALN